jgi:SAM-dependent methyltransferase
MLRVLERIWHTVCSPAPSGASQGPNLTPQKGPIALEQAERPASPWGVEALDWSRSARKQRQSEYARRREEFVRRNRYYNENVFRLLRFIVEKGKTVLDIRCASGVFLNAVAPSRGVGIDITPEMVEVARQTYPHLEFHCADPETLQLDE